MYLAGSVLAVVLVGLTDGCGAVLVDALVAGALLAGVGALVPAGFADVGGAVLVDALVAVTPALGGLNAVALAGGAAALALFAAPLVPVAPILALPSV